MRQTNKAKTWTGTWGAGGQTISGNNRTDHYGAYVDGQTDKANNMPPYLAVAAWKRIE